MIDEMPTSGLDTLAQVRGFLAAEVVGAVPAELAGEVRAAVKLLRTVETELNTRHALLRAEAGELLALVEPVLAAIPTTERDGEVEALRTRAGCGDAPLTELDRLHRDVLALTGWVCSAGVEGLHRPGMQPALDRLLHALSRQAQDRLTWQAVFPVPAQPRT